MITDKCPIKMNQFSLIYNLLFLPIVLLLSSPLFGQQIFIGEKRSIKSEFLHESRPYYISLPDNYHQNGSELFPVLYVLDGDEYFSIAASAVRYLANRGFIPQTIVVGIDNSFNRDRDLTPTKDQYSPEGGGADKFLGFMSRELLPFINANYRTNGHNSLYGASYGGLFTLYTLFNRPETFDAYLAVSPSVFHDNGLIFKQGLNFFEKKNDKRKFVFLSLADESFTEMRLNFNNLVQLFKSNSAKANIRTSFRYYDDETHETTKLKGLNDGLRTLHEFWYTPFYKRENGLSGLMEHSKLLSYEYGFEVSVQEGIANRVAYNALRKKDFTTAKELFEYNIKAYPNSPNAFDSMGEYYETQDDFTNARLNYEKAIKIAKDLNSDYAPFEAHLKTLLKKQPK